MKQIIMAALLISFSWGIRAQQLQIRGKVIDLHKGRHKNCLRISSGTNIGSKRPVAALLRGKETVFAGSQPPRFSIIG